MAETQSAYERLAILLHRSPITSAQPGFWDHQDAGTVYLYDKAQNLFSAAAADGTIKTLYALQNKTVTYSYLQESKEYVVSVKAKWGLQFRYLAAVNYFNDTSSPLSALSGSARKRVVARARLRLESDDDIIV